MANHNQDSDHLDDPGSSEIVITRRALLKTIAGAPLVVTFGMAASPLMRFLKPTMKPGQFFQAADLPVALRPEQFAQSDLPEVWNCIPFVLPMKYVVFNPEQYEIRHAHGFIIRTGKDQVVAYNRRCPHKGDHLLNYAMNSVTQCCGCVNALGNCGCIKAKSKTPVLYCPTDGSVFDVSDNCKVLAGPAPCPPRKFDITVRGDLISIIGIQQGGIA